MIIIPLPDGGEQLPIGSIIIWSLLTADVPTGWQICDGTSGTPDMRGRLIVGATAANLLGTGGATTHTHTAGSASSDGSHSHGFDFGTGGPSGTTGSTNTASGPTARADGGHGHYTTNTTSSSSHSHSSGGNTGSGTNIPPTVKYFYIMRLT